MHEQDNTVRPFVPAEQANEIHQAVANIAGQVFEIRDRLRGVERTVTPEQLTQWALAELGMDKATLDDFFAVESLDRMTERMWRYCERVARDATV